MAKGIPIHGEKLERLWRDSLLSQEMFAAAAGYGRSGLARLVRPGIQSMHASNFDKLATFMKIDRQELFKRIGVSGEDAKARPARATADESAAARLLTGEPVLLSDLAAVAKERGVSLGELFREISKAWLAEHRAPRVAHSGLEGLKRPIRPARPSTASGPSPAEPAPGQRRRRPAEMNGQ